MQEQFWKEAWIEGRTGFHKSEAHELLVKHLNIFKSDRILVPLCGKSLDMIFLRDQGLKVTGVELSPLALDQFAQENEISFELKQVNQQMVRSSPGLDLVQGNFFEYQPAQKFKAIYDRASTIALPLDLRAAYFKHLQTLLSDDGVILMILLTASDHQIPLDFGPPFFVPVAEVKSAFKDGYDVQELSSRATQNIPERYQQMGVKEVYETAFQITRK